MNDDPVENTLHQMARDAIAGGRLPRRLPDSMWGGPGNGDPCAICREHIGPDHAQLDLEFAARPDFAARDYQVHVACFTAFEREVFAHKRASAPDAAAPRLLNGATRGRTMGDCGLEEAIDGGT